MGLVDKMNKDEDLKNYNMEKHKISVKNMVEKGLDVNLIADLLGIDVEIVKEIKASL